jgi:hypothetical protein
MDFLEEIRDFITKISGTLFDFIHTVSGVAAPDFSFKSY